jgi:lipoprotein-anchoring transpeptidase ErfK/SrfK
MGRPLLAPLRRATILIGTALLATTGLSACSVARPSNELRPPTAEAPKPVVEHTVSAADEPRPEEAKRYLLLRLTERRIYLMDHDPETPVESFPIAVGKKGTETPTGEFHVEEMVVDPDFLVIDKRDRSVLRRIPPGPMNPLGLRWIGFAHGEGWTLGIHGTPRPELLGQAVSNGCVRMRNADVVRIYEHVELGTRVVVEP